LKRSKFAEDVGDRAVEPTDKIKLKLIQRVDSV